MQKVPMTGDGFRRLQAELKNLKSIERPSVIRALTEARAHGDLSENAEYLAAKEHQGFLESRVLDIEDKLRRADVIDVTQLSGDTVKFGATVVLADEDTDAESTYQLVGTDESDIKQGLLSITSPLARALIGKAAGDSVDVDTPRGLKSYEIVKLAFK